MSGVNGPLVILDQVKVRTTTELRWPTSGFILSFSELRTAEFKFGLSFSSSFFFKALSSRERKCDSFFFYEFKWLQKLTEHHFNHVQSLNMLWFYVQHACILLFNSKEELSPLTAKTGAHLWTPINNLIALLWACYNPTFLTHHLKQIHVRYSLEYVEWLDCVYMHTGILVICSACKHHIMVSETWISHLECSDRNQD